MPFESFEELLDTRRRESGAHPAFYYAPEAGAAGEDPEDRSGIRTMTYAEVCDAVRKEAQALQADPCHAVGICGTPSPFWVIHMFAAVLAGKRTVLIDLPSASHHLREFAEETGIDAIRTDNPKIRASFGALMQEEALTESRRKSEANFHAAHPELPDDSIECGGELLFFTSGTTARRKAVVLSQKALLSSAWNGQQMMHCAPADTLLCMLPLNHVFGYICSFLWPFAQGAAIAFGRGMRYYSRDPEFFRPTILPVVPSLLKFLLKTHALNKELSGLLVGAGPCDLKSLEAVWRRGIDLRFGYGLTETASGLAISLRGENPFSLALCPDTKVRIGEDGQVYVRTSCMMDGYYHDPVHTAEKLKDGELATGDAGSFDDRGRLHIQGRLDDVLVLPNGEKIYLREWEDDLAKLLGAEVMIMEKGGGIVLAVHAEEERREDIFSLVDAYNKRQPIGRKITDVVLTADDFPKTQTGKLQRWKLEEMLKQ